MKISRYEKDLSLEQIEVLEKYIGLNIPQDYVKHLLQYNGGKPAPNIFRFYRNNGEFDGSDLDWFLAIYNGEYDNLKTYIDIYKKNDKRLPSHIFPIAHDSGGNLICISCGVDDYGYIYFWDHENEVDYSVSDDSDYSNLHLIAKSFKKFIDGLMTLEEFENS